MEQLCGNCKHFQTCKSTEGWRRNLPCTGIGGVKWEEDTKNEKNSKI